MKNREGKMSFADVVEAVDNLNITEKEILVDIISKRLIEQKREEIIEDVKIGRTDYQSNKVKRGSAKDLMLDILK